MKSEVGKFVNLIFYEFTLKLCLVMFFAGFKFDGKIIFSLFCNLLVFVALPNSPRF